jgi:general secretion pathway protein K
VTRTRRERRGFALAMVLWLVVLLGVVATVVVSATRGGAGVVINARARLVARAAAESGIVAATAVIEQRLAEAETPDERVRALRDIQRPSAALSDVPLGEGRFDVVVANPNARLDLNQADPAALVGLFSRFVAPSIARAAVDALKDWADPDDLVRPSGAEADAYRRAGSRFIPRNAPLTRVDELRRVRGVTAALATAVAPYVTVSGDRHIDLNAASEAVLAAIPGIGPSGARAIASRREQGAVFTSTSEIDGLVGRSSGDAELVPASWLAVAPTRLLLVSRGRERGHRLTHEIDAAYAVVGRQLLLKSWRELDW